MSTSTTPRSRPDPQSRYLASRAASGSADPCLCKGDSLEEIRLCLQRSHEPGHYRVFDRRPPARGIDVELIGVFVLDACGTVQWRPLRSA